MARYKLLFKKSVAKDLRALPKKDVQNILRRIEALAEQPRAAGCKKLSAREFYRVRQGVYRIIYEVQETVLIIMVVNVAHRSVVYKNS